MDKTTATNSEMENGVQLLSKDMNGFLQVYIID